MSFTVPPDHLPNGNCNYAHIEAFLQLGDPLPPTSETSIDQDDVNRLCEYYNAEVDLVLKQLGFAFPITEPNSIQWIRWTKTLPVAAYVLHGMAAQDSDESITARAELLLEDYRQRIDGLLSSGGEPLDAGRVTTPRPSRVPIALGVPVENLLRRNMRFEQVARIEQLEQEKGLADFAPDDWLAAIRGV